MFSSEFASVFVWAYWLLIVLVHAYRFNSWRFLYYQQQPELEKN